VRGRGGDDGRLAAHECGLLVADDRLCFSFEDE